MKIALLVVALAAQATVPAQAPTSETPAAQQRAWPDTIRGTANVFSDAPGCTPIVVQVAGDNRSYEGTRLDRQPPARLLLAVDRQVDGCREVTFVTDRRIGPEPFALETEPPAR